MTRIENIIKGIAMNPDARDFFEDLAGWADEFDIEKIEDLHENIGEYAEARNDPAYDEDALALLLEATSYNIDEALSIYEPTNMRELANAARWAAALDEIDKIGQSFDEITEAVALLYYAKKYGADEIAPGRAAIIRAYANDESKGETIAERTNRAVETMLEIAGEAEAALADGTTASN